MGQRRDSRNGRQKGDHLIGDFYVLFSNKLKEETAALEAKGMTKEEAEAASPLMAEAREMLRKWEAGDKEVRALWEMMKQLGVRRIRRDIQNDGRRLR